MNKKGLKRILVMVTLMIAATKILPLVTVTPAARAQIVLNEAEVEQALGSTVRILMFFPAGDTAGQSNGQAVSLKLAMGMGTLVEGEGEPVIITHDHWGHPFSELMLVEFRSTSDELLLEMNGPAFAELVRYQDGGTLIFAAPQGLVSGQVTAPSPASPVAGAPAVGDVVLVIRQRPDNQDLATVLAAEVSATGRREGNPVYELRSLDGQPIVPGDSGGGVFLNGRLVGNLWSTEMATGKRYLGFLTVSSEQATTNMSTVAALPLTAVAAE
jgi:hypothetical protein